MENTPSQILHAKHAAIRTKLTAAENILFELPIYKQVVELRLELRELEKSPEIACLNRVKRKIIEYFSNSPLDGINESRLLISLYTFDKYLRDEAINQLLDDNIIALVARKSSSGKGRPSRKYYLVTPGYDFNKV
jgi:hypothetical protein